jgi:sialate O-acetylesterase
MIIQRDVRVPIWGRANPNEAIQVVFVNQIKNTITDHKGHWSVKLDPIPSGGPFNMTIIGENTHVIENILVGDVWICSGQSNMGFALQNSENAESELPKANHPNIHLFKVKNNAALTPQETLEGKWSVCTSESARLFSAVGYYFGKKVHKKLNVPIGLICSAWGGTPAEAWTGLETLKSHPILKPLLNYWEALTQYPDYETHFADYHARFNIEFRAYLRAIREWREQVEKAEQENRPIPPRPRLENGPGSKNTPAVLYNAMIRPLEPYAIKGVIWYQGESNTERAWQYRTLFPQMIQCWRDNWGQGDFPFLFVQLPNYMEPQKQPIENSGWVELQEAQLNTLKETVNTSMAVTIDLGEADNIHPKNKRDVGKRLALNAFQHVYGLDVPGSGPIYQSVKFKGKWAVITFKHVGDGLMTTNDEKVKGFAIKGEEGPFRWAQAKIKGATVHVWNDRIQSPKAVRFAWASNPIHNLYNKAGLPACPFRTDETTWTTKGNLVP